MTGCHLLEYSIWNVTFRLCGDKTKQPREGLLVAWTYFTWGLPIAPGLSPQSRCVGRALHPARTEPADNHDVIIYWLHTPHAPRTYAQYAMGFIRRILFSHSPSHAKRGYTFATTHLLWDGRIATPYPYFVSPFTAHMTLSSRAVIASEISRLFPRPSSVCG